MIIFIYYSYRQTATTTKYNQQNQLLAVTQDNIDTIE